MEYKFNNCGATICSFYENSKVIEQIKLMTYYQVYNAAKEAFVFSFSYIRNGWEGKINRKRKKFFNKALPNTIDATAKGHGIKKGWPTAPPSCGAFNDGCLRWTYPPTAPPAKRNTFRIFRKELIEHHDLPRFIKYPTVHGVRGVINAPPSGQIRKKRNVHKFVQRENQTESIAV